MIKSIFQYIQCYGSSNSSNVMDTSHMYFNTSNVTVHRRPSRQNPAGSRHFNTSNVTVHPFHKNPRNPKTHISIHPMLRFIQKALAGEIIRMYFNTSNVTVHHLNALVLPTLSHISIHPMLRFIFCLNILFHLLCVFQYIQCYGSSASGRHPKEGRAISIHPMLRFILHRRIELIPPRLFQYIQCYGSSRAALERL